MSHSHYLSVSPSSPLPPSLFPLCVSPSPPPPTPTPTSNYSICNGSGSLQHYSILNSLSSQNSPCAFGFPKTQPLLSDHSLSGDSFLCQAIFFSLSGDGFLCQAVFFSLSGDGFLCKAVFFTPFPLPASVFPLGSPAYSFHQLCSVGQLGKCTESVQCTCP